MARNLGVLILILAAVACAESAVFSPISDRHRSAAKELFVPSADGSLGGIQETYEALRSFEILGIEASPAIRKAACKLVAGTFSPLSTKVESIFHALRVDNILNCQIDSGVLEDAGMKFQTVIKNASSLSDMYYSIGGLVSIKDHGLEGSSVIPDANGVFRAIKSLSQSDGRWRYSSSGADSSTYAAGMAFTSLAGIISLSGSEVDQSMITAVKDDIVKLFDSLESYDDGSLFFDEKLVDATYNQGSLATTSSVVHGISAFASAISGSLAIPGDKMLGLANFFLSVDVPGSSKDMYLQLDSLSILENNRISVPLILFLPSSVLSLTSKDHLKVRVTTVLGSDAPTSTVTLVQASSFGATSKPIVNKEQNFEREGSVHALDFLSNNVDVGKYQLVLKISLDDPEESKIYYTGAQIRASIYVSGFIKVDGSDIAVLDGDIGRVESIKKLDFSSEDVASLYATHLQKLRLSFALVTPRGMPFEPHQVLLKLKHESKVEHMFIVSKAGKQFEITLDFLGLVEKFYYLSGKYTIELTVGDAVMENSFLKSLGHVELDLPDAPEKTARSPAQPVDVYARFGPKPEIVHIFRAPEKRPPKELSLAFLGLVLLPFLLFLVGLGRLGINFKNFPSSSLPALFAALFQLGIAAILVLYVLFWTKLDLFTTLRTLGILGVFLIFVGHRTLSHMASSSAKLKSS